MNGSEEIAIGSPTESPTKGSNDMSEQLPSPSRLNVHQPFSTFPAGALIDEFFSHSEAEGEFHKESMRRIFDLLLEFKIWSESRPAQEIDRFGDQMDEQLKAIQAKEEEQGTFSSSSASSFSITGVSILGARQNIPQVEPTHPIVVAAHCPRNAT
ncbi:hypothetical protein FRB94_006189 [Tulasnella sp. JGI-2019a]|nr:hypothetical protein FRB93_006642 [Tulasnella sp. JGI-2019a]KAG8999409.1 hypothetical protein FRB94_006189 [Tulasnella sp. JGI-2019a]